MQIYYQKKMSNDGGDIHIAIVLTYNIIYTILGACDIYQATKMPQGASRIYLRKLEL